MRALRCFAWSCLLAGAACERAAPSPAATAAHEAMPAAAPAPVPSPAPHPAPPPAPCAPDHRFLEPLPRHGFALVGEGIESGVQIVVDYDARTLRRAELGDLGAVDGVARIDRTYRLTRAQLETLRTLVAAAQREQPGGEAPAMLEPGERLCAVDGDRRVELAGARLAAHDLERGRRRPTVGRLLARAGELANALAGAR